MSCICLICTSPSCFWIQKYATLSIKKWQNVIICDMINNHFKCLSSPLTFLWKACWDFHTVQENDDRSITSDADHQSTAHHVSASAALTREPLASRDEFLTVSSDIVWLWMHSSVANGIKIKVHTCQFLWFYALLLFSQRAVWRQTERIVKKTSAVKPFVLGKSVSFVDLLPGPIFPCKHVNH